MSRLCPGGKELVIAPISWNQCSKGSRCDVIALDAETGTLEWRFVGPMQCGEQQAGETEGAETRFNLPWMYGERNICLPNGWGTPSLGADGVIYVGNQEGQFFAIRDLGEDAAARGVRATGSLCYTPFGRSIVFAGRPDRFVEVSTFYIAACFCGCSAPSVWADTVCASSTDTLYVFKKQDPPTTAT